MERGKGVELRTDGGMSRSAPVGIGILREEVSNVVALGF